MNNQLITRPDADLVLTSRRERTGQAANHAAAQTTFYDYRKRKAKNTLRRHDDDLNTFAEYLNVTDWHTTGEELAENPLAWQGMTWGIVQGFLAWLLGCGYAVGSIRTKLATVKCYARYASKAGAIPAGEWGLIREVNPYSGTEADSIDEKRRDDGVPTRFPKEKGAKKEDWVKLTPAQAAALKVQPNTPQGRRDALLMCLLLDHNLRCSEVEGLAVCNLDLETGTLNFKRPKVKKVQTHALTPDSLAAAKAYMLNDAPSNPADPLLRGSLKGGKLDVVRQVIRKGREKPCQMGFMKTSSINRRVRTLGKVLGIKGLSPHDCRHYWTTDAFDNGSPLDKVMQAGGWASPVMPLKYRSLSAIANEGIKLSPSPKIANEGIKLD